MKKKKSSLLKHFSENKKWYGFGVVAVFLLLVISVTSDMSTEGLTGDISQTSTISLGTDTERVRPASPMGIESEEEPVATGVGLLGLPAEEPVAIGVEPLGVPVEEPIRAPAPAPKKRLARTILGFDGVGNHWIKAPQPKGATEKDYIFLGLTKNKNGKAERVFIRPGGTPGITVAKSGRVAIGRVSRLDSALKVAGTVKADDFVVNERSLAEYLDALRNHIADTANNPLPEPIVPQEVVQLPPTPVESGTLYASSEGNPDSANLIAGITEQLVTKYRFHAVGEGFTVSKLTIVNDPEGDFGDEPTATAAVAQVTIGYPDINGVTRNRTATLSGGSATFSGLDLYVPAGEDVFLEIYADVNSPSAVGERLSGQKFRLGLKNVESSVRTFMAVGEDSNVAVYFDDAEVTESINNSNAVNTFVVRKSVPTFAKARGTTTLINGENTLYGLTVTADNAGSISYGRMVFDVTTGGLNNANNDMTLFSFYRGSTLISGRDVNIFCAKGTGPNAIAKEIQAGTNSLEDCDGIGDDGIADGIYQIIVSFWQEQTVSAGNSQTYYLKASVAGARTNTSVTTRLSTYDENRELAGRGTNPNTGYLAYSGSNPVTALFPDSLTFIKAAGGEASAIAWSDKSADMHLYPSEGSDGSYDWTNGYLLKVTELTSNTLTY